MPLAQTMQLPYRYEQALSEFGVSSSNPTENSIRNIMDSMTTKQDKNLRVIKFGYEQEGGFDDVPRKNFHCDGSVECDDYSEPCEDDMEGYEDDEGNWHNAENITGSGEVVSPVFSLDRTVDFNHSFRDFARRHSAQEVNETCGHHVHVSFNSDLAYARLMDSDFFQEFEREVYKFVMNEPLLKDDSRYIKLFLDRYEGNNSYCYKKHSPQSQVNGLWFFLDGDECGRYTHLNYPYGHHNTIECRLFPSPENPEQLIRVTEWFVNFTNSYLKGLRKERAKKHKLNVSENEEITSIEVELKNEVLT